MTTSSYPNLLEVYKSSRDNYLVADHILCKESAYKPTLESCIANINETLGNRTPSHKWFHSYYYQGNHYTLVKLQQLYPELLL